MGPWDGLSHVLGLDCNAELISVRESDSIRERITDHGEPMLQGCHSKWLPHSAIVREKLMIQGS